MWVLIWIRTIWLSDSVPERILQKLILKKKKKAWKITQPA